MAEINELLSPEAIKQGEQFIKMLETAATKYAELGKVYDMISDKTRVQIKEEQELEKLNKLKLQTDAQAIKNEQALAKETERLVTVEAKKVKQKEKDIEITKKQNSEYEKLKKTTSEAVKYAREMAVQYGKTSEQATVAAAKANKLQAELKRVNDTTGAPASNSVGKYFQGIMKAAGALGLAVGGIELFKKGIDIAKQSIESIQTTADKFAIVTGGLKEGFNSFLRGMATGGLTFENLIQNFKDAVAAGREYAALLDDLGDRQLALRVAESNAKDELLALEKIYKDNTKSNTERISAIDKYIAKEQELSDKRTRVAKQAFRAEIVIASERSKLSEAEIMDYITNYEAFTEYDEKKNEEYEANQKKLEKLELQYGKTSQEYMEESMKQLTEMLKNPASEQELHYREVIENMAQLDDKTRDRIVATYEVMKSAEQSALENTMKASTKRSTMIEENLKNEVAARKDNLKNLTNVHYENELQITAFIKEQMNERLKTDETLTVGLSDGMKKRYKENKKFLDKKAQDDEDAAQKEIALEKQKQDAIHSLVKQTSDTIFSIQELRLSQEMDALDVYYQSRIESESNLGKNTDKLEREYAIKKYQIQLKEFKLSQQKAIADIAIAAAVNSVEAPALTGFYAAMAVLQAGIVLAQKPPVMPAYAEGTDDAARTFLAGEAGYELMKLASGGYELATKPKIYSGSKYEHAEIFPHEETQKMLAASQMSGMSTIGIERRLDALNRSVRESKPTVNIINRYDAKFDKRLERSRR